MEIYLKLKNNYHHQNHLVPLLHKFILFSPHKHVTQTLISLSGLIIKNVSIL
jgi:hypothetical protein